MKTGTGLYMDTTDFDKGFSRIVKRYPELAAEGMYKVVAPFILRACILEQPTVPKKSGHLRREQIALQPLMATKEITLFVGFNTAYAARLHEAPDNWNWSEPGSGPKFLESKLINHAAECVKKVADYIAENAK